MPFASCMIKTTNCELTKKHFLNVCSLCLKIYKEIPTKRKADKIEKYRVCIIGSI